MNWNRTYFIIASMFCQIIAFWLGWPFASSIAIEVVGHEGIGKIVAAAALLVVAVGLQVSLVLVKQAATKQARMLWFLVLLLFFSVQTFMSSMGGAEKMAQREREVSFEKVEVATARLDTALVRLERDRLAQLELQASINTRISNRKNGYQTPHEAKQLFGISERLKAIGEETKTLRLRREERREELERKAEAHAYKLERKSNQKAQQGHWFGGIMELLVLLFRFCAETLHKNEARQATIQSEPKSTPPVVEATNTSTFWQEEAKYQPLRDILTKPKDDWPSWSEMGRVCNVSHAAVKKFVERWQSAGSPSL